MCGICGIAARAGAEPAADALEAMCASMIHRGPDDQGTWTGDGVGLGMRRLSIIDVAGGHQPVRNQDGTAWIVFNGELYNYRELREQLLRLGHSMYTQSDTEVVLHAYDEWGEAFLDRLNGMFGFAIWDRRTRTLTVARDRMGIKPVHYVALPDRLLFASELKAILAHPGVSRRVDPGALAEYLLLEYVPTPRSMVAGVAKLPPGHVLRWRQETGAVEVERWWDVDLAQSEDAAEPDLDRCAEELRQVLREAVRKELVADVPVGVFLSGGVDSSAVAAMMSELTPGNVKSFSIGFADSSFDESGYARLVARHLGTEHHELVLEPRMLLDLVPAVTSLLDEPLADASIIPTYLLSRFTRERVKVALGGDGGDELFAGYPTVVAHRLAGYYRALPDALGRGLVPWIVGRLPVNMDNLSFDYRARRFVASAHLPVAERHARWMGSFSPEAMGRLLAPEMAGHADRALRTAELHLEALPSRDPLLQVLYLDMKLYLENDILVKVDRASMMNSLEARVPLLNVDVVEHVARLPTSLKLRRFRQKFILKRALRGLIPDEVVDRPKKGFGIPVARWFRGPLRELVQDTLSSERIRRQGFFEPREVERLLAQHMAGERDNRKELWTLFIFQRWHEAWIEGAHRPATSLRSA